MRSWICLPLLCVLALLGSVAVHAGDAAPAPEKKYRLLYISQSRGFEHGAVKRKAPGVLAPSEVALTAIGKESGLFDVECSQDISIITPDKLKELDAIMFYTTGDYKPGDAKSLPITEENFNAMMAWLKSGKAFIGTHSATDTLKNFKPYYELINGSFSGHPWNAGDLCAFTNHEPTHPAVKMWEPEFQFKDEIYQYKNFDPKAVRVLISLNMEKCKIKMPWHVPVSWVRDVGDGRMFYTNLGHNEGTWTNATFQQHLLMGIRWALKLENGSSTPNPELHAAEEVKAASATLTGAKPMITDAATAAGASPDEAFAALEKLAKENIDAFKKAYSSIDGARGEKDAVKKKDRQTKAINELLKK